MSDAARAPAEGELGVESSGVLDPGATESGIVEPGAAEPGGVEPGAVESGVVDPIRIPPWLREPVERWWRDLPLVARVFLALAVVDLVVRSIGIVEPRIDFGFSFPLGFIAGVLPHDLWILLPALIVVRRPDAATTTPAIFRAAILLALVELLASPIAHLVGAGSLEGLAASSFVSIIQSGLLVLGWVLLGRGLAALGPRVPSQSVAGFSNLVAITVAVTVVVGLFQLAVGPSYDYGDAGASMLVTLSAMLGTLRLAGWGYLLWILVRGLGDTRRPEVATMTAAIGAALSGFVGAILAILGAIVIATQRPLDVFVGVGGQDVMNAFGWLDGLIAPTLILVAFALGLAEPPIPLAASQTTRDGAEPAAGDGAEPAAGADATAAPSAT